MRRQRKLGALFVSGGPTGDAYVYDARTGREVAGFNITDGPSFINDVTVTRDAAYFTDSEVPTLFRVDGQQPERPLAVVWRTLERRRCVRPPGPGGRP